MPFRFTPPLQPGPSYMPVATQWTIHVDCPTPGSGLRLEMAATFNCCGAPASLIYGAVVDDHLAAWLRGQGYGGVLEELTGVCRVDGETACEQATRCAAYAARPDWRDHLRVEVSNGGQVVTSPDQHRVAALIDAGRDWRQVALVKLPSYPNPVPHNQVWPDGGPEPALPSLPRTVDLPPKAYQLVHEWVEEQLAAGHLVIAAQLPPPAVRRQLRETADLSRPAVAEELGVSKEAIRLWENGDIEPAGENRTAYIELLTRLSSGPQEPAGPPVQDEPEPEPQAVCNSGGGWCSLHGRQHGGLAEHRAARAAAYAAQQERAQQANVQALVRRVTGR
jgi:DNA-binding transcriptional regulator YiaG